MVAQHRLRPIRSTPPLIRTALVRIKTNCVSDMDNITFVNPNYIGLLNNPTLKSGGGEEAYVPHYPHPSPTPHPPRPGAHGAHKLPPPLPPHPTLFHPTCSALQRAWSEIRRKNAFVGPSLVSSISNAPLVRSGCAHPFLPHSLASPRLVPIFSAVAYGSAVYQDSATMKAPLYAGGLFHSFAMLSMTPASIAGAYGATMTALFTAQCGADIAAGTNGPADCNPAAPTAKYGASMAKAYGTFIGAVTDKTTLYSNAKLTGAPYLQLSASAPANQYVFSPQVAMMLYEATASKKYGLVFGGEAEITTQSGVLGQVLKLMLATKPLAAAEIAGLQALVKASTGSVSFTDARGGGWVGMRMWGGLLDRTCAEGWGMCVCVCVCARGGGT